MTAGSKPPIEDVIARRSVAPDPRAEPATIPPLPGAPPHLSEVENVIDEPSPRRSLRAANHESEELRHPEAKAEATTAVAKAELVEVRAILERERRDHETARARLQSEAARGEARFEAQKAESETLRAQLTSARSALAQANEDAENARDELLAMISALAEVRGERDALAGEAARLRPAGAGAVESRPAGSGPGSVRRPRQ